MKEMNVETKQVTHTPGPWSISVGNDGIGSGGGIAIDANDPQVPKGENPIFEVAEVWGVDRDTHHDERSRANARLIAAAPDLLASCRQFVGSMIAAGCTDDYPPLVEARLALAKAEGRTP